MSRIDQALASVWARAELPLERRLSRQDLAHEISEAQIDLAGLKACFVAGTLGQGGAERQLYYILKALRHAGADVRVLCLDRNEFWESQIVEMGVSVDWVGGSGSKFGRLTRILSELRKH